MLRRASMLSLLGVLGMLLACAAPATAQGEPPNILLVVGDDAPWNGYGFMGHPDIQTPTFDQLAAEGTVFPVTYNTSSVCRPSLPGMLTGLHNFQLPIKKNEVDPIVPTLANQLALAGYKSFHGGKTWPGGDSDNEKLYGFDVLASESGIGVHLFGRLPAGGSGDTLQPLYDFITENKDQPMFMWVAPFIPHVPLEPPSWAVDLYSALNLKAKTKNFYASMTQLDDVVARVLNHLELEGERDDTVTIYAADNGFFLPKSKGSFSENGYRTPLIYHDPRTAGLGMRTEMANTVDIFPTVLDLAGLPLPIGYDYDGLKINQLGSIQWRTHLVAQHSKQLGTTKPLRQARTEDGFRLEVKGCTSGPKPPAMKLWDLNQDPINPKKLKVQDHQALVDDLLDSLDAWWDPCS